MAFRALRPILIGGGAEGDRPSTRRRRRALIGLGALVALSACATVPERDPAQEYPILDEVRIEGAQQVSEAEIKEGILLAGPGWIPSWVPFGPEPQRFDPNAWQADLRRIERFYQARGYYQARVLSDEVNPTRPGHVSLLVRVEEGAPTRIGRRIITGLEGLPPEHQAAVLAGLPLSEGELFLESDWAAAKEQLPSRLRELGYAEAIADGEAQVDVESRIAEVRLEVTPGPRYRFGKLFVINPDGKVPRQRIEATARGAIREGDWFNETALAEAQARLLAMGVFGAVKVNRGAPDRALQEVPVVVDVREAPFHTRRVGGGVGLDQNHQEVRGLFEWTNRNFFGGLRRLTFGAKLGYAVLPSIVAVAARDERAKHGLVGEARIEFEQPLTSTLSIQSALLGERGLEPAYDFNGVSGKVGVVWRPRPELSIYPSVNVDLYRLSSQVPLDGRSADKTFGCPLTCVLAYAEQTIEYDRRDDRMEPRSGFYAALSLQEGGGPRDGATFTYLRLLPEIRGYTSFGAGKRLTLAGKLKAGTLLRSSDVPSPIVARFFSGGGASMRGFNTRRLSPLVAVAGAPGQANGETLPVGGNGLFEASTEVRYNVSGDLVLAAFLDVGNVWEGPLELPTPRGLHYAVGLGIRYRTPLGPIRLDVARRLPLGPELSVAQPSPPISYPATGDCFGIGGGGPRYPGSPEGVCALHISVGEAF